MTQKITQTLEFRQQQNLVMTPQMQQAVKLLQMSNLELQDFIDAEIIQNPLLERVEKSDGTGDDTGGSESGEQNFSDERRDLGENRESESGEQESGKNDSDFESQF
ncbi:MAG: RNA polymerase sigma-54 factor, partial [Alphaproteobacteria bacterium]|nr:RNA polymerase sigma-54 factor [Alphaproteobacteria bacterium]